MFSKACEYAIRAILHIAQCSLKGERVGLKDIARSIDSPEAFTAKILQQLARAGLIRSVKGPKGGFDIPEDQIESLRLSQVVVAIDGDQLFTGCGLGLKQCSEVHPCPMHEEFKQVRTQIKNMLDETQVIGLAQNLEKGLAHLTKVV